MLDNQSRKDIMPKRDMAMESKNLPTAKQDTPTRFEVRMLTQSEKESLQDANLKAHLLLKSLIAEAKKNGPYLK